MATSQENKTQPTTLSLSDFLATVDDPKKRADSETLVTLLREESGAEPVMWGDAIVGFGEYHYRYDSGREGRYIRVGFSPRKTSLSLYIMSGLDNHEDLLEPLGNPKHGKSCLYLKTLDGVDLNALRQLVRASLEEMARCYPE